MIVKSDCKLYQIIEVSFFLDELQQGHCQYFSQLFYVVDDQEVLKGEVSHVALYLHLLLHVLHALYVHDRGLLRVNYYEYVCYVFFLGALHKGSHQLLVHFAVRYYET